MNKLIPIAALFLSSALIGHPTWIEVDSDYNISAYTGHYFPSKEEIVENKNIKHKKCFKESNYCELETIERNIKLKASSAKAHFLENKVSSQFIKDVESNGLTENYKKLAQYNVLPEKSSSNLELYWQQQSEGKIQLIYKNEPLRNQPYSVSAKEIPFPIWSTTDEDGFLKLKLNNDVQMISTFVTEKISNGKYFSIFHSMVKSKND